MHPRLLCFGHVRFSDAERRLIYGEGGDFEKRSPGDPRDPLLGSFVPYHEEIRLPSPYYRVDAYRRVRLDHDKIERDATVAQYESEHGEYVTYVQGEYRKLDAELSPLYQRLSVLREGSQKQRLRNLADKYQRERQQWYDDTVKQSSAIEASFRSGVPAPSVLSSVWNVRPAERARFASMRYRYQSAHAHLPQMTERLKNEIKELDAQFAAETQGLIVNALVQWQKFEGVKDLVGVGVQPAEWRAAAMRAVAAIDMAGSHLYAHHSHENVMPWDEQAVIQEAQKQLAAQGISLTPEELEHHVHLLTPDPNGIETLLKMKTDLLNNMVEAADVGPFDDVYTDLHLRQALVLATRRERRYLVMERGGADPGRIGDLDAWESEQTAALIGERQKMTDGVLDGNHAEKIRLAQHELHFLQSFAPDTDEAKIRMGKLYSRDPDSHGIIQEERIAMLQTLRADTDTVNVDSTDLDELAEGLRTVQKEGVDMFKYRNELPDGYMDERLPTLLEKQETLLRNIWRVSQENAGNDPVAMADAVSRVEGQLRRLRVSPENKEFANGMTTLLREYAQKDLRSAVNKAIRAAREQNRQPGAHLEKTERAVSAIAAERRTLSFLGIDADRIKGLDRNMDLIKVAEETEERLLPDSLNDRTVGGANFTRAIEAIDARERMMRATGLLTLDEERSLQRRRDGALGLLSRTVDWVAPGLSDISPASEVQRVKSLVKAEWDMRGGERMTDAKRFDELTGYRSKIARIERTLQQKEDEEEAKRRREPLESAKTFLSNMQFEIDAFNNGNRRAQTIAQFETFIGQLNDRQEKMQELRTQYEGQGDNTLDAEFETWENASLQTRRDLDYCLFRLLSKDNDPRSIAHAARIFISRYNQWKAEEDALSADIHATIDRSGITAEQLRTDLLGGDGTVTAEGSLLQKAEASDPIQTSNDYRGLLDDLHAMQAALLERSE